MNTKGDKLNSPLVVVVMFARLAVHKNLHHLLTMCKN